MAYRLFKKMIMSIFSNKKPTTNAKATPSVLNGFTSKKLNKTMVKVSIIEIQSSIFVSFKANKIDCGNKARDIKSSKNKQNTSALLAKDGLKTIGKSPFAHRFVEFFARKTVQY